MRELTQEETTRVSGGVSNSASGNTNTNIIAQTNSGSEANTAIAGSNSQNAQLVVGIGSENAVNFNGQVKWTNS